METEKETIERLKKLIDIISEKFPAVLLSVEELKTISHCNNKMLLMHEPIISNLYSDVHQLAKQLNDIIIEIDDIKERMNAQN